MYHLGRWFPCCRPGGRARLASRLSIRTSASIRSQGGGHDHDMNVHGRKTTAVMSVLNCFAGGVFLGTCFLGLMPEVREIFDQYGITWPQFVKKDTDVNSTLLNGTSSGDGEPTEEADLLPITEIIVTCGLFLILIVEQTVHAILNWQNKRDAKKSSSKKNSTFGTNIGEDEKLVIPSNGSNGSSGLELKKISSDANGTIVVACEDEVAHTVIVPSVSHTHLDEDRLDEEELNEHHIVRSLILVASLSMHSFLEGIAIGLQEEASSAVSIFIAVLLHKSLMAFSMGTSLVKAQQKRARVIKAAFLFGSMSPIGIMIGMIMKQSNNSTDLINGILQGIATGTFLYITFFEVLAREFEAHGSRIKKTVALILGYIAIFFMVMTQHGA